MPTLGAAESGTSRSGTLPRTQASSCFLPSPSVAFPGRQPCSTPSPSGGARTLASSRSTTRRSADTISAVRGDRVARRHGRRAAQVPQLLDLPRARAGEHGARRVPHSVRRRPHPPDAAADGRPLPLPALRRRIRHDRPAPRHGAGQAGDHLAVRAQPDVSVRRDSGLLPRRVHRGSAGRARHRDPAVVRGRRRHRAGRFHGGPPGGEARSRRRPPAPLHRPEQPGAGPPDRGRTIARSACTRARAATATPPTAPTSTTPTCCPACCSSAPGASTSRSPASPIASTC